MPKPPAATPALPQEHAGTDKHREQGESHSQWKANQHIWSHCMPDSRQALCCSSPISTSMAQFQICPQCSHSACCASTTQHTERGRRAPTLSSEPRAGWSTGYSHEITAAAFRKLLKHGGVSAWSQSTQWFAHLNTHLLLGVYSPFHSLTQVWTELTLYQGGRVAQLGFKS